MGRPEVNFRDEGDVLIVKIDQWDGDPTAIEDDEQKFLDIVADNDYQGVITDLGDVSLGGETQEHIRQGWTELINTTSLDRFAYVSDGIGAMATQANIETDVLVKSFRTPERAIEWIRSP